MLKSEVVTDLAANPDYIENKFKTTDGFQIGYFIEKDKATWYLMLEKYGSGNTILVENADILETTFNEAQAKIEELKAK